MGYMVHYAIIVSTWDDESFNKAIEKAKQTFNHIQISSIMSGINNYKTFCVGPDGSKEGWDESIGGDSKRALFISWLNEQKHEDGSSPFDWCEVQYGDDERDNRILQCSD